MFFCSQHRGGKEYDNRGTRGLDYSGGVETMAMPQRDDTIEAIKRIDALLEYAVMHSDEAETERLREELEVGGDQFQFPCNESCVLGISLCGADHVKAYLDKHKDGATRFVNVMSPKILGRSL